MSNFILNEDDNIYEHPAPQGEPQQRQGPDETNPSHGRHSLRSTHEPAASAPDLPEPTLESDQGLRSEFRRPDYPTFRQDSVNYPAQIHNQGESTQKHQMIYSQDLGGTAHYLGERRQPLRYASQYLGSAGPPGSWPSQKPQVQHSIDPQYHTVYTAPQQFGSSSGQQQQLLEQLSTPTQGQQPAPARSHPKQSLKSFDAPEALIPGQKARHRYSHPPQYVTSREPDGRRWSSRVELPHELELPSHYVQQNSYYYPPQQFPPQHSPHHSSPVVAGPSQSSLQRYEMHPRPGPSAASSEPSRLEGLGIQAYPPEENTRRSVQLSPGSQSRLPLHHYPSGFTAEGAAQPPWQEIQMAHGTYLMAPQPYQGFPSYSRGGPSPDEWQREANRQRQLGPHRNQSRPALLPNWYGGSLAVDSVANTSIPQEEDASSPHSRPPGGWYWSVTTAHQPKKTESRSTQQQQKFKYDHMGSDVTVPIQLCEPPLANCVPPNASALAADPPPKNRKKSKYTSEQDKMILDLKHQGLGWGDIAKIAKCDKTLAARNRYQVLIGQQGGGTFLWSHPDIRKFQAYMDEAERAKWHHIAEELSRRRGRKFTLEMCHYKVCEMFKDNPAQFGVIKSKDSRNGGIPMKRTVYDPEFSNLPPQDDPSTGYQPPASDPPSAILPRTPPPPSPPPLPPPSSGSGAGGSNPTV